MQIAISRWLTCVLIRLSLDDLKVLESFDNCCRSEWQSVESHSRVILYKSILMGNIVSEVDHFANTGHKAHDKSRQGLRRTSVLMKTSAQAEKARGEMEEKCSNRNSINEKKNLGKDRR